VQAVVDKHATPSKSLAAYPGLGLDWIAQVAPAVHCSATVSVLWMQGCWKQLQVWAYWHCHPVQDPTAVQPVAVVQDTLDKWLEAIVTPVGIGLGVGWIDQAVPFRRSASVVFTVFPTAEHALAAVQDTLERVPPPAGFAVGWITQVVPFRASASGPFWLVWPTAVQVPAIQETPERTPATVGFPGSIDQAVPFHRSTWVVSTPELTPELGT
jgi:hypothetical protein